MIADTAMEQDVVKDSRGEEQLKPLINQVVEAQERRRQSVAFEVCSAREKDLEEQIRRLITVDDARGATTTSSGKKSTLPSTWNDRNRGAGVSSSSRREGMDDQEQ